MSWTRFSDPVKRGTHKFALCRCSCGVEKWIRVLNGGLKSTECRTCHSKKAIKIATAAAAVAGTTHGLSKTPEYRIWQQMKSRCANDRDKAWADYGGRGIRVCRRWMKFENFIADMGRRPHPNLSIERRNNDRGYSPKNCKWATRDEQNRNSRHNRMLSFAGETMCAKDWARKLGLKPTTLMARLVRGWNLADALSPHVQAHHRR